MWLFSRKEKIHISDLPELLCDSAINLAWKEKTPSIDEEYGYVDPKQSKYSLFRRITITGAYYLAFFRFNLLSKINVNEIENILIKSKNMIPEKVGSHTMYVYNEEDKESVRKMVKYSYNNAVQSIVEANSSNLADISSIVAKQYILDLYEGANLSKERMDKIITLNINMCTEVIKSIFNNTRNLVSNISITNRENYKGKYVSSEERSRNTNEQLLNLLNASNKEKSDFLKSLLK